MANANVKPATAYTKNWNKEQKRKADVSFRINQG